MILEEKDDKNEKNEEEEQEEKEEDEETFSFRCFFSYMNSWFIHTLETVLTEWLYILHSVNVRDVRIAFVFFFAWLKMTDTLISWRMILKKKAKFRWHCNLAELNKNNASICSKFYYSIYEFKICDLLQLIYNFPYVIVYWNILYDILLI